MFAEKLTKNDLKEYAYKVICGMDNVKITGKILHEIVNDEDGNFDSLVIDFWVNDTLVDENIHCNEIICDFNNEDSKHTQFFIDKFGLPYVLSYKKYLNSLSLKENERNAYLKRANDYFCSKMIENGQKVLGDFELHK